MTSDKTTLFCSFCGKDQNEVAQLIAGPNVFICDECVELCMSIVLEHRTKTRPALQLTVASGLARLEAEVDRDIDRWIEKLQTLKRLARSQQER